jgi:hypothetical protein
MMISLSIPLASAIAADIFDSSMPPHFAYLLYASGSSFVY